MVFGLYSEKLSGHKNIFSSFDGVAARYLGICLGLATVPFDATHMTVKETYRVLA